MKKLISSEEAVDGKCQHKNPCSDCPWRRDSVQGWLGSESPNEWLRIAHSETMVDCHAIRNTQCAGISIYRANILKVPKHKEILVLEKNKETVFSNPNEFIQHHKGKI